MKAKQIHKGRTIHEYEVTLTERELDKKPWTDQEIIDFCDPGNFGGRVLFFPHDNHYQVWVYTD